MCERLGDQTCNFIDDHFLLGVTSIIGSLLFVTYPIVLLMFVTNFQYLKYLINQLHVYIKRLQLQAD